MSAKPADWADDAAAKLFRSWADTTSSANLRRFIAEAIRQERDRCALFAENRAAIISNSVETYEKDGKANLAASERCAQREAEYIGRLIREEAP